MPRLVARVMVRDCYGGGGYGTGADGVWPLVSAGCGVLDVGRLLFMVVLLASVSGCGMVQLGMGILRRWGFVGGLSGEELFGVLGVGRNGDCEVELVVGGWIG